MTAVPSAPGTSTELRRLELRDVRIFERARIDVAPHATTVLTGPNGSGKTTVLEAVAYLGSQRSFRTTARDSMVRDGRERAIVRADLERESRPVLVESELLASGGTRTLVDHHAVQGRAALAAAVPVTVFSPDDLGLVQGPPARRREMVDAALRLLDPRAAADLDVMERALRQRGALLRQAGGRLGPDVASTLDVWDERLALSGSAVSDARRALLEHAGPFVDEAYRELSEGAHATRSGCAVGATYVPGWEGDLAAALASSRKDDVRRGASTAGPHRDEVLLEIAGREARTRASQGEQRSLAYALRLGLHRLVAERTGGTPLLLLDDVFSELDPDRSRALVRHLPSGQALLTTAADLPRGVEVGLVVDVRDIEARA